MHNLQLYSNFNELLYVLYRYVCNQYIFYNDGFGKELEIDIQSSAARFLNFDYAKICTQKFF